MVGPCEDIPPPITTRHMGELWHKLWHQTYLLNWASCGWQRGDGGSMWGYPSTNYNSPHWRVTAQVIALDLFVELKRITCARENKILFHNIEKLTVHYKNTSHTCLNTHTQHFIFAFTLLHQLTFYKTHINSHKYSCTHLDTYIHWLLTFFSSLHTSPHFTSHYFISPLASGNQSSYLYKLEVG